MGRKVLRNNYPMTLGDRYATPDAYESGLLLPQPVHPTNPDNWGPPSKGGMEPATALSGCGRSESCRLSNGLEEQSACEFHDYCNQLYNVGGKCECGVAWRKRAGFALPVSG
jgi:hypothetical protein